MFLENHYFLADANVLIDLVQVDGLSILTKLGQVEVLDIVLAECLYPDQIQNKIPNAFLNLVSKLVNLIKNMARNLNRSN